MMFSVIYSLHIFNKLVVPFYLSKRPYNGLKNSLKWKLFYLKNKIFFMINIIKMIYKTLSTYSEWSQKLCISLRTCILRATSYNVKFKVNIQNKSINTHKKNLILISMGEKSHKFVIYILSKILSFRFDLLDNNKLKGVCLIVSFNVYFTF